MIGRDLACAAYRDAVVACDPEARVRAALAAVDVAARLGDRRRLGIAVGKAARAMARGAGEVADGVAIVPAGGAGAPLPAGWRVLESAHPWPDARSVDAARAARALISRATADDVVLALVSGGASALLEEPRGEVTLDELGAVTRAVMASGAPIGDLNAVRSAVSAVKAGGLVAASAAPVVTLAVSDVVGDALAVIGSGPTVTLSAPAAYDAAVRGRAATVLAAARVAIPAAVAAVLAAPRAAGARRPQDLARVIAPMAGFAQAAADALAARGVVARVRAAPVTGDVAHVAAALAAAGPGAGQGVIVAWGEPTLAVPAAHGEGGRAQQLALELARHLRGTARGALVIGSDGVDGPPPRDRPAPAGAFVDGATWDAIAGAGRDPAAALARRDAGPELAAVGALVITGPTGVNHADLVVLG